jgi:hypothetical protein
LTGGLAMVGLVSLATVGLGFPAAANGYHALLLRAVRGEVVVGDDVTQGLARWRATWSLALRTLALLVLLALPGELVQWLAGGYRQSGPVALYPLLASAVLTIAAVVGACLLAVVWTWASFLLADGVLADGVLADGAGSAGWCLRRAAGATLGRLLRVVWFAATVGAVMLAGALALGVGLLVTVPLGLAAVAHGYTVLFRERQPPEW